MKTKVVMVGHVDHGKSTLIGRLLFETESLPPEKLEELRRLSEKQFRELELAYLLDALEEEQEQNVTIDTTQINFQSGSKDYLIIDAPGHKEFLKNMVTGAANADVALLLLDAQEGIQEQTKRHLYLLKLIGIEKIIVVINKMDLVQYAQPRFEYLQDQIKQFMRKLDQEALDVIPISAKTGDNITKSSPNLHWYQGKTILQALDSLSIDHTGKNFLRFPIQDVYKWTERMLVGRIESGSLRKGDSLIFSPSLRETRVKAIHKWNKEVELAHETECIGITMEDQIFVERGEIASLQNHRPKITEEFSANIFWLGRKPLQVGKKYILKLTTHEQDCEVAIIRKRIDPSTLEVLQEMGSEVLKNEVAEIVIATKKPIALDNFKTSTTTGRSVLVDECDVAGGGIVVEEMEFDAPLFTS